MPKVTAAPRRLTAKGSATRDRIVAAAAALTYERGVAGTSIEDVRAATGVSASQLYHYFADKRALTLAVIAHQIETVVGGQAAVLDGVDGIAGLRAWREAVVGLNTTNGAAHGCPIGSLASELSAGDTDARADLAAGFDRWHTALRDGLARMRAAGALGADADPDTLASATLASLQGGLLLAQVCQDPAPLATALEAAIAHIESFAA